MSEILKLADAFAKAQGAFEAPKKNRTNPHFKSKYADLAAIIEAVRGPLAANGLSFMQIMDRREGILEIRTILLHASGELMESRLPLSKLEAGAQPFGSELTYMRRYALAAMLGVAADDDDDDGNASQSSPPPPRAKVVPPPPPSTNEFAAVTDSALAAAADKAGWLAALHKCFLDAPEYPDIEAICNLPRVRKALSTGAQDEIQNMINEAVARFAKSDGVDWLPAENAGNVFAG